MEDSAAALQRTEDDMEEIEPTSPVEARPDDRGAMETIPPTPKPAEPVAAVRATGPKPGRKRPRKPVIDLDDHIRMAQEAIKSARKQVQQARVQAKLEKRRKQRLVRKASNLNVEDLERIADLKRCGLVAAAAPSQASDSASSSAVPAQASCASDQQVQVSP